MTVSWGYIFHAPGTDPKVDRVVIEKSGCKTTLVGVPSHEAAVEAAKAMAEDGVKAIELCGAFGFAGATLVKNAVEGKAVVNFVVLTSDSAHPTAVAFGMA